MLMPPLLLLLILASMMPAHVTGEPLARMAEMSEDPKGGGVRFTRPDGTVVYVNPRSVAYVRAPLAGEHGQATIVFSSGHTQQVLESVEQVIRGIHIDMPGRGAEP